MRMSKRPTNTVTDTNRSKTVLNKSADVLQHVATRKMRIAAVFKTSFNNPPLPNPQKMQNKGKDIISIYPEYQGTISKKSGFICFFFFFSNS